MNTEQERADFETWCKRNEYDHVQRLDGTGYNNEATKRAWKAWQARAATQSQDREDAERYRWLRSFNSGDVRVVDITTNTTLFMHTADATIDHARRSEREGE